MGKERNRKKQGNGSSAKEPTNMFSKHVNSEPSELPVDSKREQRSGSDAYL